MRNSFLNYRIYLADSKIKGLHEIFHYLIENFIFFRWMFFKNRPRSTFLLIRAFLITGIFCCLYYLTISKFKFLIMGVDVDPVLLFSFMAVIGYWNMLRAFYDKNNYCSNLYNEIVKESAKGNNKSAEILRVNLATQLLSMDLWSHRIYSGTFVHMLENAIEFNFTEKNDYYKCPFSNKEECVKAANDRKLQVGVARNMLMAYQHYLEDQLNS